MKNTNSIVITSVLKKKLLKDSLKWKTVTNNDFWTENGIYNYPKSLKDESFEVFCHHVELTGDFASD